MTLLLLWCGVAAIALPGIRPRPMLEASPHWFTRLAVLSVVLGITGILGAVSLSTFVGGVHLLLGVPSTPVDHLAPEGTVGAAVASAVLVWVFLRSTVFAVRVLRMRRSCRADGWLGEHEALGGVDLVVLPTDAPVAYNVPGRRPQVVISQGLRHQFDDDLLRFVVDHERAHLRSRHSGVVLLATALETVLQFVPGATRTALAMRVAVERTADEEAAGHEPMRRRHLARGIAAHGARMRTSCGSEVVQFRSRTLAVRAEMSAWLVGLAAAGVAGVAISGVSVALHATADFGPYLALL